MNAPLARASADFDVAIVGAGMVGAALAALLAKAGLRIALIEKGESTQAPSTGGVGGYDLRVSAITRASEQVLRAAGAWTSIKKGRLGAFRGMAVWDAQGEGAIHFDSADICESTLGYVIENRLIQSSVERALSDFTTVSWYRPAALSAIDWREDKVELSLQDGHRLSALLLVGADGADSTVRKLAGIAFQTRDYQHSALVCTVITERPHGDIARQRFLPTGPLAFLPLAEPHLCSIVWSTSPDEARELLALSDEDFRARLGAAFDTTLGRVLDSGPRAGFPLARGHAQQYVKHRLALVGDAAHRIHPLAGQGVNLGFLDAAALAEVLKQARQNGEDLGEHLVLRRYERWRKGENLAMIVAMDAFKELFSASLPPVRWARNLGLSLTDAAGPVKRLIMRRAMGLEGDLPRVALTGSW
jgi:2-octaprenylphenol hydroxylase